MGERRRDKGNWSQEMEDWRQEMGVESGGRLGVGWARHQLGTPHLLNVGNSQQSCIMSSNNESFKKKYLDNASRVVFCLHVIDAVTLMLSYWTVSQLNRMPEHVRRPDHPGRSRRCAPPPWNNRNNIISHVISPPMLYHANINTYPSRNIKAIKHDMHSLLSMNCTHSKIKIKCSTTVRSRSCFS